MSLRLLPADYVERVRFRWERALEPHLQGYLLATSASDAAELATALPLSENSAPRLYRLSREVASVLGCSRPFALFHTRAEKHLNAEVWLSKVPFAIRLIGSVASVLDDVALKAMIGHEFGHYLAHGASAEPRSDVLRPHRLRSDHPLASACSVAAELTADRFALVACQELEATVRLEVASATGERPEALGLRELDYLAEACGLVDAGRVPLVEGTHPSREFRLYAIWLFSLSDVYRSLTSAAGSELSLATVDAQLTEMLLTPELESFLESPEHAREMAKRARLDKLAAPVGSAPTSEVGVLSDLEARFRKLEADVSRADDLERRFRELERRGR